MRTEQLCEKWGLDDVAVEALRRAVGGHFTAEHRRPASRIEIAQYDLQEMSRRGMLPEIVPGEDMVLIGRERVHNIVTNQGLDHLLDVTLSGATQITAWYVSLYKTNTGEVAGNTYASPGDTEIAGSDVDEATRQAWTDAGVSSQAATNAASPAVYTAAATVTVYSAGLVGGGSAPTTIANTAGGGQLYSRASYSASKALTDDDTLTTTYALGMADDGA